MLSSHIPDAPTAHTRTPTRTSIRQSVEIYVVTWYAAWRRLAGAAERETVRVDISFRRRILRWLLGLLSKNCGNGGEMFKRPLLRWCYGATVLRCYGAIERTYHTADARRNRLRRMPGRSIQAGSTIQPRTRDSRAPASNSFSPAGP